MPNVLDGTGLQVKSVTEIRADLTVQMQGIYGADINVDQNSPDGQNIGIFAQATADQLELLVDVYNSFGVETAYGDDLDQRVALNGITRNAGSYTTTPVTITVNQALTLPGLDQDAVTPFTVKDGSGRQWILVDSHVFSASGSASLSFRAAEIGVVEVTANTITNQVTVTLGVTAVNNPTTAGTIVGLAEETDAQLKIRHGQMFYLPSVGPADAVRAAILSVPGVLDAYVPENDTAIDANGVPAHGIWAIVTPGTAAVADIAQAIYSKKGMGCAQKGSETYVITRPQGNSFTAKWDNAIAQDLFLQFGITPISGAVPSDDDIKAALVSALTYKLGQVANIGQVIAAMLAIVPNAYLTSVGVSDDGMSYGDSATPSDFQHYFTVSAANIDIT